MVSRISQLEETVNMYIKNALSFIHDERAALVFGLIVALIINRNSGVILEPYVCAFLN